MAELKLKYKDPNPKSVLFKALSHVCTITDNYKRQTNKYTHCIEKKQVEKYSYLIW